MVEIFHSTSMISN